MARERLLRTENPFSGASVPLEISRGGGGCGA